MSDNESWHNGLTGQAPGSNPDWNSYQAGKSIRDWNQAELARQNAVGHDASWDSSNDAWAPQPLSTGGATPYYGGGGAAGSSPVAWNPGRKSYVLGIFLSMCFGPLGLFYASKTGALILLATVVTASLLGDAFVMQTAWTFSYPAAIVWTVFAIAAHNRSVSAG